MSKSNPCRNPTMWTDQSGRRWGKGKKKQESGAEARGCEAFLATGALPKGVVPSNPPRPHRRPGRNTAAGRVPISATTPARPPLRPHLLPSVLSLSLSLSPARVAAINTSCRRLLPSHLPREAHTDTHKPIAFSHAPL